MFENTIEEILERDEKTKKCFKGVFAFDEAPKRLTFPCCFILNSEKRSKREGHWLALHYNDTGFCSFFDSYGNHPDYFNLTEYLNDSSSGWTWNRKRIQGDSKFCGYYCIFYLIFKCRKQLAKYFNFFGKNFLNNDKKIEIMIKNS
jgi:hypothetical protein